MKKLTNNLHKKREGVIHSFKNKHIGVIGDIMLDHYIVGDVERISPEAPIPVVCSSEETEVLGGAANVAANVVALGGAVSLLGILGEDDAGKKILKECKRLNVDTSGVVISKKRPTTQKIRIVAHGQQIVRVDREEVKENSNKEHDCLVAYIQECIADWDGVVISDYAKGVVTKPLVRAVIAEARKKGIPVIGDIKPAQFSFCKNITLVAPNKKEAFEVAQTLDVKKAGRLIQKKLGCHVLLTCGSDGLSLFTGSRAYAFPATAGGVVETTGAGDTVTATAALALASKTPLRDVAFLANSAGGIVSGKMGVATVSPKELITYVLKN